jgi:2-polyprenyl-3-methyl-5-hydroxy-6-metoxy-1,4-benzoquinol methylase
MVQPTSSTPPGSDGLTCYEKKQAFNPLVSYLHTTRYKHLIRLFTKLSAQAPSRTLRVVDIGCAHAKVFHILNSRFNITYIGIDQDETLSGIARARYSEHPNFKIITGSITDHYDVFQNTDVILALETLEHIPENLVVRLIEQIALAQPAAFMCSVPNEVGPAILVKNIGSLLTGYMRHKEYTWAETLHAALFNLDRVETHGTGHKGFDWRWLAQTIRHNMRIDQIHTNPFDWLPKTFSLSIIFICLRKP